MEVSISSTALKIISAMTELSQQRKDNKKININSFSISKVTGLSWETVDKSLRNNLNIKEIQNDTF
jgi:hypothetical protein